MNNSNLKSVVKNLDNNLYELVSHLICSICQELLKKPVTTPCGHSFCNGCIKRVLSSKDNSGCPLCKNLVKRYCLEADSVKATLIEICQELPSAFEKDVEDLGNEIKEPMQDTIKMSKLAQFYNQECLKEFQNDKNKKPNAKGKRKSSAKNKEADENDSETFLPVLKRSKKVLEYANAKKKKMDDLISISQTEVASNSSLCNSFEMDKKLKKIEKIPPEEKVKEWFDAIGDNIYINSPASSIDSMKPNNQEKNFSDEDIGRRKTSMTRRDYNKSSLLKENEVESIKKTTNDPYEFIPSQSNPHIKKRKTRRSAGKERRIPGFQALQNFTKESIKRNAMLLKESGCEGEAEDSVKSPEEVNEKKQESTASQKFDKLLSEIKENEKNVVKAHTLYSASQASSPKFLDISYSSKIDGKTNAGKRNNLSSEEEKTPERSTKIELFTDCLILEDDDKEKKNSTKRRRTSEHQNLNERKKKLSFPPRQKLNEIENLKLKEFPKPKTKLLELLTELITDETIYNTSNFSKIISDDIKSLISVENEKPKECSVLFEKIKTSDVPKTLDTNNQTTDLIGFCTQEMSSLEEKKFKEMVANMEEELALEEFNTAENDMNKEKLTEPLKDSSAESSKHKINTNMKEKNDPISKISLNHPSSDKNFVPFNILGKIKKGRVFFIDFLHLGRLTPTTKRSKSSVVKLVFPIGLTSFAKKRLAQNKFAVGVQTSQILKSPYPKQVSEGIQTSQKNVSSALIQTSQRERSSVEIQTTQEFTSTDVQTSSTFFNKNHHNKKFCKSVEIQTSQVLLESAEVQTSQVVKITTGNQTTNNNNIDKYAECGEKGTQMEVIDCFTVCSNSRTQKDSDDVPNNNNYCQNEKNSNLNAKSFSTHRKVINNESVFEDKFSTPSSIELSSPGVEYTSKSKKKKEFSGKLQTGNCEIESEFEKSWINNNEFVELKNKKNKEKTENLKRLDEELDRLSEDSDVQPQRSKKCRRILSQDSSSPIKFYETRQMIPLDVKKTSSAEQIEVVSLESSKESQCSEEQMLQVLRNIDADLKKPRKNKTTPNKIPAVEGTPENLPKGEESDSDFFVEQTPPKGDYSSYFEPETKNVKLGQKENLTNNEECNSENVDFMDSIPRALLDSESFLMLSAPDKILTPEKQKIGEHQVKAENFHLKSQNKPKEDIFTKMERDLKPNENDQNQLNSSIADKPRKRDADKKPVGMMWKPSEQSQTESGLQTKKKLCVVASIVKNPEMIKKFVHKFKVEFSNKPTKSMTHLIVGLHENEDKEVLPLCTPKLLFAMANKKWVVSEQWVEMCLKKSEIVPEEDFETLDPVGGCGCRRARLSTEPVLKNCEIYLLGVFQTISKEEFADLILDCGGVVVSDPEKFSFSLTKIRMIIADGDCLQMDEKQLQDLYKKYTTVILSRDYIITSIQSYKLTNFTPYLLHFASEDDLLEMGYSALL